ncbi:hypothetical protein [Mesorhizobium loti]|uniref:hypothetical protein n=1 Tax=Rhizobium loti TaxID=381 RepID=UPI001FD9E5BA|nr:hypothetical protein [Mesorhizobium loti]
MVDRYRQQFRGRRGSVEMLFEKEKQGSRVAAAGHGRNGAVGKIDSRKKALRTEKKVGRKIRLGVEHQRMSPKSGPGLGLRHGWEKSTGSQINRQQGPSPA